MGVKTVDENNKVVFHPVTIIQASTKGIWVSGLPKNAQIITIGQGFVEHGVQVRVEQVNTPELTAASETQVEEL